METVEPVKKVRNSAVVSPVAGQFELIAYETQAELAMLSFQVTPDRNVFPVMFVSLVT